MFFHLKRRAEAELFASSVTLLIHTRALSVPTYLETSQLYFSGECTVITGVMNVFGPARCLVGSRFWFPALSRNPLAGLSFPIQA
jgi:hypothetical protein